MEIMNAEAFKFYSTIGSGFASSMIPSIITNARDNNYDFNTMLIPCEQYIK